MMRAMRMQRKRKTTEKKKKMTMPSSRIRLTGDDNLIVKAAPTAPPRRPFYLLRSPPLKPFGIAPQSSPTHTAKLVIKGSVGTLPAPPPLPLPLLVLVLVLVVVGVVVVVVVVVVRWKAGQPQQQ
jgi:hypothetical protein